MNFKEIFDLKKFKKAGPEKWIILAAIGILIVVIVIPTEKKSSDNNIDKTEESQQFNEIQNSSYEAELEKKLADILSNVDGAGAVSVMITLDESEEIVLQTDSSLESNITNETDSDGGQRTVNSNSYSYSTVLSGSSSNGEPYIIKQIYPKVAGVVVIAEGAGSAEIQSQISEAVQALFDIPAHKIKVLKAVK